MRARCWPVAGLMLAGLLGAAGERPAKARVDVSGGAGKIEIKAGAAEEGVVVAPQEGSVMFQMPVEADQWKAMTLRFTPAASGQVNLSLKGEFRKDAEVWVYYDAVQVTGATITNGDFEEKGAKNLPANWVVKPGQHPVLVRDAAIVKSGKACLKVSHGNRVAQDLTVTAGTEVCVTLQARLEKVAESK